MRRPSRNATKPSSAAPAPIIAEEGSNPVGSGEWRYGGYTLGRGVAVVSASNGGQNLQTPVTIYRGAGRTSMPRLAAESHHVYAVWDEVTHPNAKLLFAVSNAHAAGGSWNAPLDFGSVEGISQLSADGANVHVAYATAAGNVVIRSRVDAGQTFSDPIQPGTGHEIVVQSNGQDVYVAWEQTDNPNRFIMFAASHDGGATFNITSLTNFGREPILSLYKDTGRLSLVWRVDDPPKGFYWQSTDGGTTWNETVIDVPARQFMVVDHGQYVWISYVKEFEIGGVRDWQCISPSAVTTG